MTVPTLPAGTVVNAPPVVDPPEFATRYANLASADFGATVVSCSDDFFGEAQRMLQASDSVFIVGKFDDHGKWVDGWETQRRRRGGNDHAIVRLGLPGVIKGFDIDTSHFTGNFPPAARVQACYHTGETEPDENAEWVDLIATTSLSGGSHHFLSVADDRAWTHVKLSIYPDGGVARFRVYGQPQTDWDNKEASELYEVSALAAGGRIISYSDGHFGGPFRLIYPGRGVNMGDGWETRRRRDPGFDWCVIELGHAVTVEKIEVDTAHFKGNYPDRVSIQAALVEHGTDQSITTQAMFWPELLGEQHTEMHKQHFYEGDQIRPLGPVSHVRLNMFPDGGISRLRIWGRLAR